MNDHPGKTSTFVALRNPLYHGRRVVLLGFSGCTAQTLVAYWRALTD
jgi:hypothetical protein